MNKSPATPEAANNPDVKWHSDLAVFWLIVWCLSTIAVSVMLGLQVLYWPLAALFSVFTMINAALNTLLSHLYKLKESA